MICSILAAIVMRFPLGKVPDVEVYDILGAEISVYSLGTDITAIFL